MDFSGKILIFSRELKLITAFFVILLSIGFLSALRFVSVTTEASPKGISENYLGNEDDLEAEEMKFEKSEKQMLSILHTHILSMATIFFLLSLLLSTTPIRGAFRKILLLEPMVSVLLTFGGIYLLWSGLPWAVYLVLVSGFFMTFSFALSVAIILFYLFKKV